MSAWIVYSKDGLSERCVLRSLEYGGTHMGERAVTATFDSSSEVAFEVFDYIEYRGEKFELEAVPTVKKTSDFNYEYELRFVSLKYELERCEMRDLVPNDNGVVYPTPLTFTFTGDVRYLAERIQACLDYLYGKGVWSIIVADDVKSEEKNISIAQQNCWNALALVSTTYGLNFYVKGRTITIGGEQSLVGHTFEYGKGNGLYEIERAADTGTGIVTKLRAYGASRNLDYSYPKKPEWSDSVLPVSFALSPLRLMLPTFKTDGKTDYVLADEATIAKYGIREASMVYDDIYPTITGATYNGQAIDEIKAVDEVDESKSTFTIELYDLGFDLEEHLTTSDAQISMKTGTLQGYTFNISGIEKLSGGYKLTLGRNSLENSEESGAYVPSKNWNMAKGDKFVLLNILMPQAYIREAENRLLARAKEYLAQYGKTNFSYNIGLHDKFLVEHPSVYDALVEGARLSVYDAELGISEDVTIQSITITENMEENILPQVKVTLNNEPSASTLDRIQGKLNEVAAETAANSFSSQSELMAQYRKKLDKPFFEKLFVAIDKNGNEIAANDVTTPVAYILAKYDFASVGGMTMYAEGGVLDIPSIYNGLPIDNETLYWEDVDGSRVLKARGSEGGGGLTEVYWDDVKMKPSFALVATSGKYADLSGLPDLSVYATTEYLTAELKKYVTLNTEQTIGAHKNFLNGLSIGGLGITKSQDDVIYLDANLVVRGGITMYAEGEVNIPSIIDSLPIASTTAKGIASFDGTYFAVDSNGKVTLLAANVGLNEEELAAYLTEKKYATQSWVYSLGYASSSDLNALQTKVNDFLEGSDTDTIINKWKELKSFLSGLSESDNLATILGTKANQSDLDDTNDVVATKWTQDDTKINNWDNAYKWGNHADAGYALKSYVDNEFKKYVTLADNQTISGVKTFTNGLKIGTSTINQSQNDVIYIDANLVVRGGITMYSDNTVDVGTIFDALPIDGNTIFWENGVLKANITEGVITNITSDMVVGALGFTPYNASNPKGYISGITSSMVVSALGYTPLQNHQTIYALTIQKNGTNVGTYTPNSAKKTINIVVPTKVSELDNDEEYATTSDLDSRIDALINGAPTAFDTLKEIADVLQGNVNSIGDIITTLGTKADKAIKISAGTGLSGGGTLEADRTLSLATSGVTAGTYKSVTVDKYGRVTNGTNPTTLAGYGITDAYTKTKVDELLGNYVTIATKQPITGEKNFTGGLKVNGSPIVYDATNKYWKLEGDLLVTGGVTMFASDSAFTPSTIMDAIAVDGKTISKDNGYLEVIGGTGGGLTEVYWDDVIGRPTLLSSFIDDVGYLQKSGGQMTGGIGYTLTPDNYEVGLPVAGCTSYSNLSEMTSYRTFIGSVYSEQWGEWYNILSVRHRNGVGDGRNFGMYILSHITNHNENLSWNRQREGVWQGERVILDSVNWSQYVTAGDGGNYLPLSGGTLNGSLSVKSSYAGIISVYRTTAGGGAWIDYYASNQSSSKWRVGTGSGLNEFTWETPDGNYPCRIIYDKTYGTRFEIGQNFLSIQPQSDPKRATLTLISTTDNPTDLIMGANNYDWSITARGSSDDYFLGFYSARNSQYVTRMYRNGNVLVTGGITMYSDIRKKTKLQDVELSLSQIANAPLIEHYYNSDAMRTTHVGSIAQYWASMNDWFCKLDNDGYYTMEIQNAALASAISIARELVKYESKTDRKIRLLKDEVKRLKKEIKILKSA